MAKYSVLSLDLNNSTANDKRRVFYEGLAERKWQKVDQLTTLWWASWKEPTADESIISQTKAELKELAKLAGVNAYDAAIVICAAAPTIWKG